jgi:hypothetical protein
MEIKIGIITDDISIKIPSEQIIVKNKLNELTTARFIYLWSQKEIL